MKPFSFTLLMYKSVSAAIFKNENKIQSGFEKHFEGTKEN